MNSKLILKKSIESTPYWLSSLLGKVPYRYKLGSSYSKFSRLIKYYENATPEQKYEYVVPKLNNIVQYAQNNIPFYQKLYGKQQIKIKSLSDFEKLPIITKSEVREYTKNTKGAYLLNTGGSSGEPLSLFVDKDTWAREWAHMHFIWKLKGYKESNLMLTMLGRNIGNSLYKYNPIHNEFRLNPYIDYSNKGHDILALIKKYPISFFQGYPSTIYKLFKEIEPNLNSSEKKIISDKIKCCLLSSEYPMPYMIDYLKRIWNLDFLSWYGHSEMCILAFQRNIDEEFYYPFVTYGYAEEQENMLIGTSFHNYDMPLIRYSTGDVISSQNNNLGIMERFKITSGREGDYIIDKNGSNIPLNPLTIGRHHKIYEIADYIQVYQKTNGQATFYITFSGVPPISIIDAIKYFDLTNVDFEFDFEFLDKPIRTSLGKLKLRITEKDLLNHQKL